MHLSIDAKALQVAANRVLPFCAKGAHPPHNMVRLLATENLTMEAFDGQQAATTFVDAKVTDAGEAVISHAIVSACAALEGVVSIDAEGDTIAITDGTRSFTAAVAEGDIWPRVEHLTGGWVECDLPLIARIASAAGATIAKPELDAVFFVGGRIFATDGYRLLVGDTDSGLEAKIPSAAFARAAKALEGEAFIATGDRTATITDDTTHITTLLVQGPDFEPWHLLRESSPNFITCRSEDLLGAISTTALLGADEGVRRVAITPTEDGLVVSRKAAGRGRAEEHIAGSSDLEGAVGFNEKHLAEMVKALAVDEVTFGIDGKRQVVVHGDRISGIIMQILG